MLAGAGVAQDVRYLRHQAWSVEEGLPQDSVHAVLQSPNGFVWVATEGGVARFDGVTFETFRSAKDPAFKSDDVCCLAAGTEGEIWAGTADGVVRLAPGVEAQRFGVAEGLPSATIQGVVLAGKDLLVLTSRGLAHWTGERFQPVSEAPAEVTAMSAAGGGGAWLVTGRSAVLWRNGRVLKQIVSPDGAEIEGVVEGQDGGTWVYSRGSVVLRRNGAERRWQVGGALRGSRVETVAAGADGAAWVGTNDGLMLLHADGPAPVVDALTGNTVLSLTVDREGDVWVGTETSGLHVLRPGMFRGVVGLRERSVTGVVQATDGAVWVGTSNDGLRRLADGGRGEPVEVRGGLSSVMLALAPAAGGGVWAGTPDGLELVDRQGHVRRTWTMAEGLPDEYAGSLAAEPSGGVWVGTRHGLAEVRANGMVREELGAGGELVGALLRTRRGDLWVASSGGLLRRDAEGAVTRFGDGAVTAMVEGAAGEIWVAGSDGQIGLAADGQVRPACGLPGERIAAIVVDGAGSLWVRATGGLYRFALEELRQRASNGEHGGAVTVVRYGRASGLPSEEMAATGSPMLWRMADGEIWAATRRGVAIADPAGMGSSPAVPLVSIEQFLAGDQPVAFQGRTPIKLRAGYGRLTMEYAGLSFLAPGEVRYRFRLRGFDAGWTDAGGRRAATYTNVPPGRYVFQVQARVGDGRWSEPGAAIAFRVVPPVYRRWWALALEVLALAGLVSWAYWLRLRAVRKRYEEVLKERSRIAREIHDTLAQDFVGVTLQLDLVAQGLSTERVEAGTRVCTALEQIAATRRLVTDGLTEARRSIWALRSNLAAGSLPNGLRRLVDRHGSGGVVVRLVIEGAYRVLGREVEREVLRIAGEALANAERHAAATEVTVSLGYAREVVRLQVEDNGRGFDVARARGMEGHYGLRGLEERARVIGGELEIVSEAGVGTTVRLVVPAREE